MNEMSVALLAGAGFSLFSWIVLILFRGNFWRADQCLAPPSHAIEDAPMIVAIIPARNEEMTIGTTISSLLEQDYTTDLPIILVNDNSEDDTIKAAEVAVQTSTHDSSRLTIIDGTPLPEGWTGKMWAVAQGVEKAQALFPNAKYYLFSDADISHHPQNVTALCAKAEADGLALTSIMVKLRCTSWWEHLLIPAFIFFFQKLYPFAWVNNPKRKTAGAAGGCMLINREHLEQAGAIAAIKGEIIDDCALAKLLKKSAPIWLGLCTKTISLRGYDTLSDIWNMVCRTAYVQLKQSIFLLLGTIVSMMVIYVLPILAIAAGFFANIPSLPLLGLGSWGLMMIAYTPTLRMYQRPIWEACLLPLAALLYTAMTIDSARRYWMKAPPIWKGRNNAP